MIRVDIAGKGKLDKDEGKGQEHDQSKAVFLGNVKFNEQEDNIRKHFENCGHIIDVRLVRDTTTGMGKGFGYVNFDTPDAVEKVSFSHSIILQCKKCRSGQHLASNVAILTVWDKTLNDHKHKKLGLPKLRSA